MVHVNKEENDDIQMFNIKFVQFKKTLLKSNPALWQRPSLEDRKDGKEKILQKGYLKRFGLSFLKQVQLEAMRSIERHMNLV